MRVLDNRLDGPFNSTVIEDIYIKESGPRKRLIIEVDRVGCGSKVNET